MTDTGLKRLRILATGDLHAHLTAHDYLTNTAGQGFARTASRIETARAEAKDSLFFDAGDLLIGSALGERVALGPHPMVAALNAMQADAGALGNHDFDYGLPFLRAALSEARYPVLCANLRGADGAPLFTPRVMLTRAGLRIGVTAALPPQVLLWNYKHFASDITSSPCASAIAEQADLLRAEGADLVIALAHTGFGPQAEPANAAAEQTALLVARLPQVDLVIAAHSHHRFPSHELPPHAEIDPARGLVSGKPLLMAGFFGSDLAVSDLTLQRAEGRWRIIEAQSETRPCGSAPEHPAIRALAKAPHEATLRALSAKVGETRQPLHSYFSLLGPDASLQLPAEAMRDHLRQALRASPHADLPIIAASAPFRAGGRAGPYAFTDIQAGPLTEAQISALCLFPNALAALRLTGAEIAEWLEHCAGQFRQIRAGGADQPLLDSGFACYNFDCLFGLSYEIDPSQPARYAPDGALLHPQSRRIRDLRLGGAPLAPDQEVILATTDYRASGAGRFCGASPARVIYNGPPIRALLRERLAKGPYDPVIEQVWRLRPQQGTRVCLQTGPSAAPYLSQIAGLEAHGLDPQGFLRLNLAL